MERIPSFDAHEVTARSEPVTSGQQQARHTQRTSGPENCQGWRKGKPWSRNSRAVRGGRTVPDSLFVATHRKRESNARNKGNFCTAGTGWDRMRVEHGEAPCNEAPRNKPRKKIALIFGARLPLYGWSLAQNPTPFHVGVIGEYRDTHTHAPLRARQI